MRRSATDTRITVYRNHVKKRGNERIGEQGRWLIEHRSELFPRVFEVTPTWYTMERLQHPPMSLMNRALLFHEIVDLLHEHVWSKPGKVHATAPHYERSSALTREFLPMHSVASYKFMELRRRACLPNLPLVLSHGDPTFDNVMLRDGKVVLIDPNPAVASVGDYAEVDLAWTCLSLMGYESHRYQRYDGLPPMAITDVCETLLTSTGFGEQRTVAVLYFMVFNALRALRYIDNETSRKGILSGIIEPILNLRF